MNARVSVDVLVVGAGLAGLHAATLLAARGHDVLLVDRRPALTGAIRTTGIFVRRTLDDFPLPAGRLGPPIRRVVLYPPGLRRPVTLVSARDEYRVGDMAGLYTDAARAAADAGVRIALGTRYAGRREGAFALTGPGGPVEVRARFVVGADGARSRVARDLRLDRNRHLLVGAEEVFTVPAGDGPPTFHCVLDPTLAPGYLAWVVNDGRHAHVGVAGYADRFPGGLRYALRRFAATAPGLPAGGRPDEVERRGGPIPVGGVLRRIGCPDGLLVGDAAGAVSPLTAGGLDPCLRLSNYAAVVLDEALRTGRRDVVSRYDGASLRSRFRGRLTLRHGLAQVRTPAVASAAFTLLRTPLGRAAARGVLFGDRSFPAP
ncbi:NAD(P)/FAD-dependent oxidoreductase [Micromonospora sp. RP3T]|uniref:NAD(P)/FAD-dependent oxidoreductase n=1 Tax=Micromonospora sp. RP3T TaxID=2135446 RepID=UPI000D162344|nr:NAD(P)/FAD-dependent oxidoreductase [Micromonospora sp. RP3T]PTA47312.1 FAD-binding monooxygenase [Micromonospora sp. RP3T]